MAFTISYEVAGKPISQKEKDCDIIYSINGKIKKIEHIAYWSIERYTYYLSDNETVDDILINYKSDYIDIVKSMVVRNYRIEETNTYDKNELYVISKILFDQFDNDICWQNYYVESKLPIKESTDKIFHDDTEIFALGFGYDENGLIKKAYGKLIEKIKNDIRPVNKEEFLRYFPDFLNEHPYYETSDFYPVNFDDTSL